MTSSFNVQDAAGYEQLMGRWSQKLAIPFIDFAGLADGEKVLDVGCGTGSLTFVLAKAANLGEIAAIDFSPVFVAAAQARNTDPRIKISQADACALPFPDKSFDRTLALLVLHFVPEAPKAIAEMARVTRPGGVVAATVWDHCGGMPGMRMVVDSLAALGEAGRQLRARYCFQPMMQPGEMKAAFVAQGLSRVEESQLLLRMDYADFNDLWVPIGSGEGPIGKFVATLDQADKARAEAAARDAYEAGRPDGPRSFANIAWAVRGIVA
ncbi:methyltransferase domain-containing protein [Aminobacter sp. NyZ550]|jgi:SAM-dependent methyltransferase|uniref:SAM-dependent methyltransferase n=1 Tax=Aminobacter aminovorans TaxID=83263 RepID=A0AAC8YL92_AMIAI|nr:MULTISPECIES: class I SAM-dependent methyltransferase [Aminobacter]AMS40413.1 SAM-dependent methyltransferase [Aminobacter aminovorans]MBB3708057.1 SAM-dependent methyltransferase [Aminobacter aminovorans]WAX96559.1 methyltransferase domain-containing protein [Aminobacter sp. NyZ550]